MAGPNGYGSPPLSSLASFNEHCRDMAGKCREIADRERRLARRPQASAEARERALASAEVWEKRAMQFEAMIVSDTCPRRLDQPGTG